MNGCVQFRTLLKLFREMAWGLCPRLQIRGRERLHWILS
jgi:hypothetical protein